MSNLKNAILASTAIFTLIAQPVLAEGGEFNFWPTPEYKAADGSFTLKARGRIFQDFAWISDSDGTIDTSENETRTARLGFELKTSNKIKLKVEADFIGGEFNFKDASIEWGGPVTIKVGNFKIAAPLEEGTSGRHITFMDTASFADAFSLARSLGISVAKSGSNWSFVAGIGKGDINNTLTDALVTYATRVTYSPQVEDMDVHLGASVRYRKTTGAGSDFLYRQRPHSHMAPRFINTGNIADNDTMFGAEFAVVKGPFSVQAEYSILNASLSAPEVGQNDPSFSGGYVSASYFLTGESRNYSASKGSFGNVVPNNPVSEGGLGAWQLAARFDTIDLSDEGIFGGKQDTYIFGVNWHLTRHVRLMFNASTSNITDATLVAENGADGANKVDAYGVRMQVNW